MRMSEGVEWALHSCLNLAWLGPERAVTAVKLAAFFELPPAYLNKQLQALSRNGIVSSTSGPRGGFRLARQPDRISLMDVVVAIEGAEPAFRCAEIRQQGPEADAPDNYQEPCIISSAMRRAELSWRKELAAQSLAFIMTTVERDAPLVPERTRRWFETTRT